MFKSFLSSPLLSLSLVLNIGLGIYTVSHMLAPSLWYKTPVEKMQVYLQYVPATAKATYQQRLEGKLSNIFELDKKNRQERQKIADLMDGDTFEKSAMMSAFQNIRENNQQMNLIYQETLVDVLAELPKEQRQETQQTIIRLSKKE